MKPTCILSASLSPSLPACLPSVRPTSSRSVGPVFFNNTEYWHAKTYLSFWLWYIHYAMVSPFASLSLWLVNEKVRTITEEMSINCRALPYYITLMVKCKFVWLYHLLKLLKSTIFGHAPIQVNQDGFMFQLICIFLGCDLPIHLLLVLSSSAYNDRLVDHFYNVLPDSYHELQNM